MMKSENQRNKINKQIQKNIPAKPAEYNILLADFYNSIWSGNYST